MLCLPPVPPLIEAADEGVVILRSNVTGSIRCSIIGVVRAPAWYKNNIPLSNGSGITLLNDRLEFQPVRSAHSGWYTCAASNEYGRTERDFLVIAGSM